MQSKLFALQLAGLLALSRTMPVLPASRDTSNLEDRQLLDIVDGLMGTTKKLLQDVSNGVGSQDPSAVVSALVRITPTATPTSIPDAQAKLSSIWADPATRSDFYPAIATQVANGLLLGDTLETVLDGGLPVGENSINNDNPSPPSVIYPKKSAGDAPYSLSEDALRKAIYIPSDFTYGEKPAVLFVPGTGSYGGSSFGNNLRKLLTGTEFADPVWLNVPGAMLADAQLNSEYIAYAINYISAVCSDSKQISVISWSQGGLDTQWVFKYWPSTQSVVQDFLPVSPDFKGTVLANILCLSVSSDLGLNLCPPSVIQQEATSDYIRTFRGDDGSSAYVPTTTFYSGFFDEIVVPQQGTSASAFLEDVRHVGVSNNQVQTVCSGQLGGSFYGHAGVLYNPLTYALIVDALTHDGPGDVSRIDVKSVCASYAAPGLDLDDILATAGLIPVAAVLVLTFPQKMLIEPPLRSYAL